MKRQPRLQSWALLYLPVVCLAVSSVIYIVNLTAYLSTRLAPIVAQVAAETLHREVRIARVSAFEIPGHIVLKGVQVSNSAQFATDRGQSAASATTVDLQYSYSALLAHPLSPLSAVSQISLYSPVVFVERLRHGGFNFSDILNTKSKGKSKPFQGVLKVDNGTAIVQDDASPSGVFRHPHRFTALSGEADFSSPGAISYSIQGSGEPSVVTKISISGQTVNPVPVANSHAPPTDTHSYALDINFVNADLHSFSQYIIPSPKLPLSILGGRGGGEITVKETGSTKPQYSVGGTLEVKGGSSILLGNAALLKGPISEINGSVTFTPHDAAFACNCQIASQPLSLDGTIVNLKKPQLYFEIGSDRLNYSRLRTAIVTLPKLPHYISLTAALGVHAWVSGSYSSPTVDASLVLPTVAVAGYSLKNLTADITYSAKRLQIHSVQANDRHEIGIVSGSGYINLATKSPEFQMYGQARSVDLSQLPLTPSLRSTLNPFDCKVSLVFNATQVGFEAKFASSNGTFKGIPYEAAEGEASWRPGEPVALRNFFIRQHKSGLLVASGNIPTTATDPRLNLQFHGAQIDLSRISSAFSKSQIDGLGYVRGTLTGALARPSISGHLFLLQPSFGSYSADVVTANVSGNTDNVVVHSLVARHVPGSIVGSGTISNILSGDPVFDLSLKMTSIPISYLAETGQKNREQGSNFPLSGFISGSATVSGRRSNIEADGTAELEDGAFQEFQIEGGTALLHYALGRIDIRGVRANIGGVAFAGTGDYALESKQIQLDVNATASDLGVLTAKYVPNVQIFGGLLVAAQINGVLSDPTIIATVSTKNVAVEGTKLIINPATFSINRREVSMTRGPLSIKAGEAEYELSKILVDLQSHEIQATASVTGETIPHIMTTLRQSPYFEAHESGILDEVVARMPQAPTGSLNISSIDVSGPLSSPKLTIDSDLTNADISGQKIDRLHAQFVLQSHLVSVSTLQLRGPSNEYLDASGTVDTTGPVDAKLEASGFNLALLDPYLPRGEHAFGGLSDLSIVVSGQTKAPTIAASITLDKPGYGSLSLDRIDSGEIDIKDDHIRLNGVTFTKEEQGKLGAITDHTMTVTGSIPFEWKSGAILQGEFPVTVPMALTVDVPNQTLGFINRMEPDLPVNFPVGTGEAQIRLTGTIADKQVSGEFSLKNASIISDAYQTSLSGANVELNLSGKTIAIRQFTANSNFGGSIDLAGDAQFTGDLLDTSGSSSSLLADLNLNLKVLVHNFVLNERKIALFNNAGLTARLNNGLTISGPVLRPTIAGEVDVDRVVGSLPQTSTISSTPSAAPSLNPKFDVTVKIKPEAQIKTAQLNAQTDGSFSLTGSLYRPVLDGAFLIRKGQFYFPTATFKVVPVGVLHLHFSPPDDISEVIQLTAITSISVSPDVLARNPVGVNSTLQYTPSLTTTNSTNTQRYNVTVAVSGDLQNPDHLLLSFQSDPPGLTDSQILAVLGGQQAIAGLTGGNMVSALQTQVASVFNASVVPKILQPFEDSIGTVLGLEDFSIDYAPESPVQVTIVKRLGSRLSVQYTQSVNSRTPGAVSSTLEPPDYQVKLGYSFTPRLQFTISTDDQRNNIVAIEGVHNF